MNPVLQWAKANVFIIIFSVVIIASMVSMPFVAGKMNAGVRESVQQRAHRLGQLSQLERTSIRWPGREEQHTGVVNEHLLQRYRELKGRAQQDAEEVFNLALERNRQNYTVLLPELFPAPPAHRAQILPRHFHERLIQAYDNLLSELGAGTPPSVEGVRQEIELRRAQFVGQILARDAAESIPPEEEEKLRQQLADLRLLKYQEAAERLMVYLSRDTLRIPRWEQQREYTLAELFEWQWRYWIHSDVLRALHAANQPHGSLLQGPVKRVVRFDFATEPKAAAPSSRQGTGGGFVGGGGDGGMGGGVVGGGGAVGGGGTTPGASGADDLSAPVGPVNINHKAEAPRDYQITFTGRTTNALYDVRYVDIELIVETERVPELLDALAQHNFMTVVWLRLTPASAHADARDGYFYGTGAVSRLAMQLETVWLRSWTAQYMPATTRSALGITSAAATPGSY